VAALAALALAGCGHVTSVGTGATLQISLNEYRVMPQDVHAGSGTLTIVVRNDGRLTHDLVITQDGRQTAATEPLAPGQTTDLVTALPPGRYLMSSTILSDQALGVYGTLDVHH
jgi:cupredoxin-like protein